MFLIELLKLFKPFKFFSNLCSQSLFSNGADVFILNQGETINKYSKIISLASMMNIYHFEYCLLMKLLLGF